MSTTFEADWDTVAESTPLSGVAIACWGLANTSVAAVATRTALPFTHRFVKMEFLRIWSPFFRHAEVPRTPPPRQHGKTYQTEMFGTFRTMGATRYQGANW